MKHHDGFGILIGVGVSLLMVIGIYVFLMG